MGLVVERRGRMLLVCLKHKGAGDVVASPRRRMAGAVVRRGTRRELKIMVSSSCFGCSSLCA